MDLSSLKGLVHYSVAVEEPPVSPKFKVGGVPVSRLE